MHSRAFNLRLWGVSSKIFNHRGSHACKDKVLKDQKVASLQNIKVNVVTFCWCMIGQEHSLRRILDAKQFIGND